MQGQVTEAALASLKVSEHIVSILIVNSCVIAGTEQKQFLSSIHGDRVLITLI